MLNHDWEIISLSTMRRLIHNANDADLAELLRSDHMDRKDVNTVATSEALARFLEKSNIAEA